MTEVRPVAVVAEQPVVRRADHVEVEVHLDGGELVRGVGHEVVDVERRADQATLLGAPPGEAQRVLGLAPCASCSATSSSADEPEPLSLMPGPSGHRVEVGAGHDDVGGSPRRDSAMTLRRHRLARLTFAKSRMVSPGIGGQLGAERVGRTERGEAAGVAVAERHRGDALAVGGGGVPLVEEQDPRRARGRGVLPLTSNVHVPRWIRAMLPAWEAGEVGGLAAAGRGVAEPELDVDRGDRRRVTSPGSECGVAAKSVSSTYAVGVGCGLLELGRAEPRRTRRRRTSGR